MKSLFTITYSITTDQIRLFSFYLTMLGVCLVTKFHSLSSFNNFYSIIQQFKKSSIALFHSNTEKNNNLSVFTT